MAKFFVMSGLTRHRLIKHIHAKTLRLRIECAMTEKTRHSESVENEDLVRNFQAVQNLIGLYVKPTSLIDPEQNKIYAFTRFDF